MATSKSLSPEQAVDEYFDMLIKSRFIEMFGTVNLAAQLSEWSEIKAIGTVLTGSTPKTNIDEYWDGQHFWITPAELSSDKKYYDTTERRLSDMGLKSCSLDRIDSGTVLLTSRAPIGKVGIATTTMFCNQGFKNIRCSPLINSEYLYTLLLYNTEYLNSLGRGATFKEISRKIVESIRIPVPPIELQNQFADFVRQVDKSKVLMKKCFQKFDQLVKSRFIEMFGNVGVGEYNCPKTTVGEVCSSIVRGPFGSALKKDFFVSRGPNTVKVYEQKHAIQKDWTLGTYYIDEEKFKELSRFECHGGDFIMSCSGTMGELYQLPDESELGIINQALCKFTLSNKMLPRFFTMAMSLIVQNLQSHGSAINNIAAVKYVKQMAIPLPDIDIQNEFVSFANQVDKSKFIITSKWTISRICCVH